jgi:hypothetical protein
MSIFCHVWWHVPVIPGLGRLSQDDCKFPKNIKKEGRKERRN